MTTQPEPEMPGRIWAKTPCESGDGDYSDSPWIRCPFVKDEKKPAETKYIRADIVELMAESLKKIIWANAHRSNIWDGAFVKECEAALSAYEEGRK